MSDPLSADQQATWDNVVRFVRAPKKQWYCFQGLAGVGKTKVMSDLAGVFPDSMLVTPTGKSASVLRNKTGLDVGTIHSAIYDYRGQRDDDCGKPQPIFTDKGVDLRRRRVFLDECSMVDTYLAEDLLATGALVIACGDPGQLPPVKGKQFFSKADSILTQIHRQALDSPIIRQAYSVRNDGIYAADGDGFRVITKQQMTRNDLAFGSIALCWRNATRQRLNVSRRREFGFGGNTIEAGEPIMVLKNDYTIGVYNGGIYTATYRRPPGEDMQVVDDAGHKLDLINVTCEGIDPEFETHRYEDEWTPIALAYAATTHKAQGSEWNDVLVIDEYNKEDGRRPFLYTAFTRAAKRVLVVQA